MYLFYKAGVVLSYIEAFTAVSARSHNMSQKNSLPIVAEIKPSKLGRSPRTATADSELEMSRFVDFHQLLSIALWHHAGLVE